MAVSYKCVTIIVLVTHLVVAAVHLRSDTGMCRDKVCDTEKKFTQIVYVTCCGSDYHGLDKELRSLDNSSSSDFLRIDIVRSSQVLPFHTLLGLQPQVLRVTGNLSRIKPHTFQNHGSSVRHLLLPNNSLTRLWKGTFDGLDSLEVLDLSRNRIYYVDNKVFARLPKLWHLDVSRNDLVFLPSETFDHLPTLTYLDLSHNHLAHASGHFPKLENLKVLRLGHNDIRNVDPKCFVGLASLTMLSLTANGIRKLKHGSFGNVAATLEILDLSQNRLAKLDDDAFHSLYFLRELNLSGNGLARLPTDAFNSSIFLKRLDLSHNSLTLIFPQSFHQQYFLLDLLLHHNCLNLFERDIFDDLLELRQLRLDHNCITDLPSGTLQNLSRLSVLRVDHNKISHLIADLLERQKALRVLDASYNSIISMPTKVFRDLPSLRELRLNGNNITTIEADSLHGLPSLQSLEMSSNRIEIVHDGALKSLTSLENLDLRHNRLRKLPRTVLPNKHVLQAVHLEGNPLQCDCSWLWLGQNNNNNKVQAPEAECHEPRHLRGRRLETLTRYQLTCK